VLEKFRLENKTTDESFQLTDREKEVLECLVKGMSYKMIAAACFISIDTVRHHIKNIYDKLHVNSKSEAVAMAIKRNIV
jgi:DNA-binding CsgD family transcriptional regulator